MKKLLSLVDFLVLGFFGFCFVYYPKRAADGSAIVEISPLWYVLAGVIALVLTLIIAFFDKRFDMRNKFWKAVYSCREKFITSVIMLIPAAGLGALIEVIISHAVYGKMTTGDIFNVNRFYLLMGVCFVVEYIVYFYIKKDLKAENLFFVIALTAGCVMIFGGPYGHLTWDNESHYRMAVSTSNIYGQVTYADNSTVNLEDGYLVGGTANAKQKEDAVKFMNEHDDIAIGKLGSRKTTVAHIPMGLSMAVCRFFGTSYITRYNVARLVNLLVYVMITFFAIKRLRSGKMILMLIALFPTNVFMAANMAYDTWVTAFVFLGIAFYLSEAQQPNKFMTTIEAVVMCGSLCLACMPKEIYFPVLLIPFFLKKNYFKVNTYERKKFKWICICSIAVLFVAFVIRVIMELKVGGDMRGGSDVNAAKQIVFILTNPFKYIGILFNFLKGYITFENANNYICCFAYLNNVDGYMLTIVLVVAAVLTDKNDYDVYTSDIKTKVVMTVNFLISVAFAATALYIAFTPVGLDTINGCQARYTVPMLFPMLAVISTPKIVNRLNRNLYNAVFGVLSGAVMFLGINQGIISRVL